MYSYEAPWRHVREALKEGENFCIFLKATGGEPKLTPRVWVDVGNPPSATHDLRVQVLFDLERPRGGRLVTKYLNGWEGDYTEIAKRHGAIWQEEEGLLSIRVSRKELASMKHNRFREKLDALLAALKEIAET